MKNKLWTFGCSFTESLKSMMKEDLELGYQSTFTEYYNYLNGKFPPMWSELLSSDLNLELENRGKGGSSNYSIFSEFIKNLPNLKQNDLVIIQWSSLLRFRVVNDANYFIDILPSNVSDEGHQKYFPFMENREKKLWYSEVIEYTQLITEYLKLKKVNFIFWSMDEYLYHNLNKDIAEFFVQAQINGGLSIGHYEYMTTKSNKITIKEETNYQVDDEHFGKDGNYYLYELLKHNYNRLYNSSPI